MNHNQEARTLFKIRIETPMKKKASITKGCNKRNNYFILMTIIMLCITACKQQTAPEPIIEEKPITQYELISVEVAPIITDVETGKKLFEVTITNQYHEPIKVKYVDFDVEGLTESVEVDVIIDAQASHTVLHQSDRNFSVASMFRFAYQTNETEAKGYYVDIRQKFIEDIGYYKDTTKVHLPLIPNNTLTIYAWKENKEWKFDYVEGREKDVADVWGYDNFSLINVMKWLEPTANIYFYIRAKDGEMDDKMKSYVMNQMDFITKYENITFLLQGEEEKFKEFNQVFPYMETIVIFPGGKDRCELSYCTLFGGIGGNMHKFTTEQKNAIGKRSYSIDEMKAILDGYPQLYYFVIGKDKKLTIKEGEELAKVFEGIQYYPEIENRTVIGADKPVIYLYPQKEMKVRVEVDYHGTLHTTYPEYHNGWDVIAKPDGSLTNLRDDREYSYLFWEGSGPVSYPMDKGFVVKKEDSVSFLQHKLAYLGLSTKESNDFIVYWLPHLNKHDYNLIVFQDEAYKSIAKLNIDPKPDSIQRVFMTFKGLDKPIHIESQILKPFTRSGFTVIEWGGVEISDGNKSPEINE